MSEAPPKKTGYELIEEMNAEHQKDIEFDRRKKDVAEKDLILRENRVNRELTELIKNTSELEQAKTITFGKMTDEDIQRVVTDNDEYMEAAKHSMEFINSEFKGVVPFFRKNLILVGGDTGDGKSTSVANIIFSVISRKDPITKKSGRCLVLTNEEAKEDVLNRVTCLIKGWKYTNHDQFSEEQKQTFKEYIPLLTKDGRITVISDVHNGVSGFTTTPEGVETIIKSLIESKEYYSTILLDYYQNIKSSKVNPKAAEWECQQKLCGILDLAKISYPAPIVVFAQMAKLTDEEDTTPFNVRLKGRKLLCDKATFIVELIPERKLLRSKWKVWKSRFTEAVGQSVYTGYDRGKFVAYNESFKRNVAKLVEKNLERDKEEKLGMGSTDKEDPIDSSDLT